MRAEGQGPSGGPGRGSPGTVQIWEGSDRLWRYRYLPSVGEAFLSNRGFVSREEAVESARLAYPGEPMVALASPPRGEPRRRRRLSRALIRLGVVAATVLSLRAVVRAVLRARRLGRRVARVGRIAGLAAVLLRPADRPPVRLSRSDPKE